MEFDYKKCNLSDDLNGTQLRDLNLAMSITGGLGTLLASAVLLALLCIKAYKTVLQRLFIYTVLTVILQESSHAANMEELFHYDRSLQEKVCAALGFVSNWSGWCLYIFYLVMILYLLIVVCVQIGCVSCTALQRYKFVRVVLEILVVVASLVVPVLLFWVPYRENQFGFNGYFCLLKYFRVGSCNPLSFAYKFAYNFSLYELVGAIAVIVALGMIGVYCTLSNRLQRASHMIKYLSILLIAIVINMIIMNLLLAINTYSHPGYWLKMCFSILATVDDFIFLSGYLLAFYSGTIWNVINRCICSYCCEKKPHNQPNKEYGTFAESNRTTIPSNTYFDIQYTGEFTDVTYS